MKKYKIISLLALALFVAGCSNNTSNTSGVPESSNQESSESSSYPRVILKVKTSATEVEIGQSIDITAIASTGKATFECSDTSVATLTADANGLKASLKGVKEGSVTITLTSTVNPNTKATVKVNVITTKPSLRQVIKNIQGLKNYTLSMGVAESGVIEEYSASELVLEDTLIYTDNYGSPIVEDDNGNGYVGKKVTKDGKVVYIKAEGDSYQSKDAPIVQCNAGLLTKDNFKGLKDKTIEAFQVGDFYSYDVINPSWVTDEKAEDNTYVISGESLDDNGNASNITGAYLECQLWKLADIESYEAAVSSLNEAYYWSLASLVETTITVNTSNSITVTSEVGNKMYMIIMSDMNETSMEYDISGLGDSMDDATASSPTLADSITKAIDAIKTNNYVQVNSMFPDHKTELKFNTYFTPDYVFYDCNKDFKNEYNTHLSADTDEWTKSPYGYIKKSDGIYQFTYDEDKDAVTISTTKEANTDANTSLPTYLKYFSTISTFNSDLKYSFNDTQESIWNNHSTKYYHTDSRAVFDDFINYYAPEDIADVIENVKSGLGVSLSQDNKVQTVYGTLGYTPFDSDTNDISQHTYGVDYFELNSFGQATNNKVNAKLA